MFGRLIKNKSAQSVPVNRRVASPSVIAIDMNVLGNIVSDGVLDIDGKIDGNVRAHTVSIRPNGKIRGDVTAENVHVHGVVEGVIKAANVTLYAECKVVGTVMHEALTIEDGAFIDGKCKRTDKLFMDDEPVAGRAITPSLSIDTSFDNDNDEPPSELEIKVLQNLRLIS